jgi:hypothetical protein
MLSVLAAALVLGFHAHATPIPPAMRAHMVSWRQGCPVAIADLRLVRLTHWGFDGRRHTGRLVVNRDAVRPIVTVMRRLYELRFPIRRMVPVDAYGGDDWRSIEADNTSVFNCRRASGSSNWSNHAFGEALDLNPIENPYVSADGSVEHAASRRYLDRSRRLPGMIQEGDAVVRAFDSVGWGWGGRWSGAKDYQHFSVNGR